MTEALYVPTSLLNGYRALLDANLPADIRATIAQDDLPTRAVNLWPGTPVIEGLALAGGMRARIRLQVTSVGTSADDARKIGGKVRWILSGRTPRYRLVNQPLADDVKVIDVVASEGRTDGSGAVKSWTEMFTILFDADEVPAVVS